MIYYIKIFLLLISSTKNWPTALIDKKVKLKNGLIFNIRNFMDWYVIIETVVLNCYHFSKSKSVVIDIGAAIGDFTVLSSKNSPHVYAIEPEPSSINLLKVNLIKNKIKNVTCLPIALHHSKKTIKLSINSHNHHHTNSFSRDSTISVPSISFADLLTKINKSSVYVKCDCEGGEYDIFNKLSKESFQQIDQISMEYHLFTHKHQVNFNTLQKILIKNKFNLVLEANPIHSEIGFLFARRA